MAGDIQVTITGLELLRAFDQTMKRVPIAARRAVNFAANKARVESGRRIREQVAFSARYLTGAEGKITFKPAAATGALEARLSARSRPSSLARFVKSAARGSGARVQVKPGTSASLPGAFLIGIGGNQLLAVRSPRRPRTAYKPKRLGTSLWLLYGPSVAQTLISAAGRGIWPNMEAEIIDNLEREFLRQMGLKA